MKNDSSTKPTFIQRLMAKQIMNAPASTSNSYASALYPDTAGYNVRMQES